MDLDHAPLLVPAPTSQAKPPEPQRPEPQRPAGKVDFRLVRNLRPGQWIWPTEWTDDEPTRRWALVVGNPVTVTFTGGVRVCLVQCAWPDGGALELRERPGRRGRVIVPAAPYRAEVTHEVLLLSGEHPRFPGLGMSTVAALPDRAPQVAVMAAERALEQGQVTTGQADLIVEDRNPVTGLRRYRLVPSEQPDAWAAGAWAAELIDSEA